MQATHPTYRPEIDGLRAIAVLPVIMFHAGSPWFSGGYVGVDVFFVISGYLITSIILNEKASGKFTISGFYERRARRILPALFLVMLVCLLPSWLWMMPKQLKEFAHSLVAVSLFGSNILFWRTSGYFDTATEEKPLLHTWSLGVEEQYYVLFPLMVILMWRLGRRNLAWILVIFALASLGLTEFAVRRDPMANFYLAPTRAWELLIGSSLAFATFAVPLHVRAGRAMSQAFAALGLLMIVAAVVEFDKTTPVPGYRALLPTLGTALVLAFATEGTHTARLLSQKWIVGAGLISYSAYLWHQPLFAFARIRLHDKPSPLVFGLLGALSMVLAYFTWRYVEAPFRDRKRFGRKPIFVVSFLGSLLFIAIGLGGHSFNGYPERFSLSTRELLDTAIHSPMRGACHTRGSDFLSPSRACTYFNQNVTWAALGDSHIVEPAYVLADMLRSRGQGLLHLSFSGCPPALLVDAAQAGCTSWLNRSLERLELDHRIVNVLVGFRYSTYLFGDQLESYPNLPDEGLRLGSLGVAESREAFWRNFEAIVARLRKAKKRVFVLLPIPELGHDIQKHILAKTIGRSDYNIGTPRPYFTARNRYIDDKFKTLDWGTDLVAVVPSEALCDRENCYAVVEGKAMYFDDDHLSLAGARKVLAILEAHIDSGTRNTVTLP